MDYRLLEQCKAGNAAAVEDFVQMYQREVYGLALSILDDSHEAEDATRESFGSRFLSQQLVAANTHDNLLSPHASLIQLKLAHAHL